jgi:succinate dehydrogenase / fumarate reductase cytochrome b subunit
MTAKRSFWSSTIGQKIVMAVTGVILFGFVLGHMVGNLQLYLGAQALNDYAVWLREFAHGAALPVARITLIVAVFLHIWSATSLTLASRAARPTRYRMWEARESTYASRTMRWGGVIILLFVIYHLMHFTWGNVHPSFVDKDVYHNVVTGFAVPWVSAVYILAMLALGLHLKHGLWSMFQTLGVSHPRYERYARVFATVFAAVVVLGNISFPIAVLAGWVR